MEWFSSWFTTSYYHILYKNRNHDEAKRFLFSLTQNLKLNYSDKILDLACGKGHSIELNSLGYNVVGADLSKNSIDFANQYSNEKLNFKVADMRALNVKVNIKQSLIFSPVLGILNRWQIIKRYSIVFIKL